MNHPNFPPRESRLRPFAFVSGVLVAVLSTACASAGRPLMPGQPMQLHQGEQAVLPDAATLRYLGVGADSRCRPEVQCIRAGDADVNLEFTAPGTAPRSISINTDTPVTDLGRWRVRLLALDFAPLPRATLQVDAPD